jgi:hypothetical protein
MKMKMTSLAALLAALFALPVVVHGQTATFSGSALASLHYSGSPDAQYVAASGSDPAYAALSTPDSGLYGDAPAVQIKTGNFDFSQSVLSGLSATYSLFGAATGPASTEPYWLTYVNDPTTGGFIGIVSFGGSPLDATSQIHTFFDYDLAGVDQSTHWGETLGQLESDAFGSTTYGQLGIHSIGVEIGDYNNGVATIPAAADISSITINVEAVPEPSTVALAGFGGLLSFVITRRFRGKNS